MARSKGAELHMITVEGLPRFPATIDEIDEEKTEANYRLAPVIAAARADAQRLVSGSKCTWCRAMLQKPSLASLTSSFMGHSALYQRIIGGATDRLVRLAPCAVLVVK
jgi:nucleotide-binding universal stress UspA family protein